jgi:hypothetical protein
MSEEVKGVTDTKSEVEPFAVVSGYRSVPNPLFDGTLTFFGWFFLVVGVLLGIFFIWKSGDVTKEYASTDTWGQHGYSWGLMVVGMFSIMQGLFLRLILEGIAEIIRLLRWKK